MNEAEYWKKIVQNDREGYRKNITKLRKENLQIREKLEKCEEKIRKIQLEFENSDMITAMNNIMEIIGEK